MNTDSLARVLALIYVHYHAQNTANTLERKLANGELSNETKDAQDIWQHRADSAYEHLRKEGGLHTRKEKP